MSKSGSKTYEHQIIKNSSGQPIQLQGWGAAAADIDGDGDIDIVMAQNNEVIALENKNSYWVLRNAASQNEWVHLAIPQDFPTLPRKVFLIPRTGARPDLAVGGDGAVGNITFAWMKSLNTSTAPFYRFNSISADSSYANAYVMTNNNSASIYDVAKKGSDLIILAKDKSLVDELTAVEMLLLRYSLPSSGSIFAPPTLINYSGNTAPDFIFQFKLDLAGRLAAYDGACQSSNSTRCSFSASPP